MADTLGRILVGSVVGLVLTTGALILWVRTRQLTALVQLIGAAGILMVALTHLAEATRFLTFMGWGRPDTVGHYLDLASALVGATLFPVGYLAHAARARRL